MAKFKGMGGEYDILGEVEDDIVIDTHNGYAHLVAKKGELKIRNVNDNSDAYTYAHPKDRIELE